MVLGYMTMVQTASRGCYGGLRGSPLGARSLEYSSDMELLDRRIEAFLGLRWTLIEVHRRCGLGCLVFKAQVILRGRLKKLL